MTAAQFKRRKAIITIARKHFKTGKNRRPAEKRHNPHFGVWESSPSKTTIHFNRYNCRIFYKTRLILTLGRWGMLETQSYASDSIKDAISASTDFTDVATLTAFREKIKHL